MMFDFKVRRIACGVLAAMVISAVNSLAVTSQFRGVNWADKRDNFVSEVLVLSGVVVVESVDLVLQAVKAMLIATVQIAAARKTEIIRFIVVFSFRHYVFQSGIKQKALVGCIHVVFAHLLGDEIVVALPHEVEVLRGMKCRKFSQTTYRTHKKIIAFS